MFNGFWFGSYVGSWFGLPSAQPEKYPPSIVGDRWNPSPLQKRDVTYNVMARSLDIEVGDVAINPQKRSLSQNTSKSKLPKAKREAYVTQKRNIPVTVTRS